MWFCEDEIKTIAIVKQLKNLYWTSKVFKIWLLVTDYNGFNNNKLILNKMAIKIYNIYKLKTVFYIVKRWQRVEEFFVYGRLNFYLSNKKLKNLKLIWIFFLYTKEHIALDSISLMWQVFNLFKKKLQISKPIKCFHQMQKTNIKYFLSILIFCFIIFC